MNIFSVRVLTKVRNLTIIYDNRTPRTEVLPKGKSMWPMGGRFYA
jgi:hypothetical protein